MADDVRHYLTSEIETLRSAVFRAGALNAKTLGSAAEAQLENVLGFLILSPPVEDAIFCCVTQITAFARALYAQAQIGEIEQARRDALAAIDALAIVMEGALPDRPMAREAASQRTDGPGLGSYGAGSHGTGSMVATDS